jgi:DNA-directed RNA polymerase subunit RPC12/RpoP
VKHVVARCENCGAALRVDPSAVRVDCDYCRVTCFVKDAPPNTPQVTIAPAPEPVDETKLTLGIGIVCAVLALGGVVIAATSGGDARAIGAGVLFIGIFGTLAVLAALGYPRKKEYLRHVRRLRDEGIPGRATVKSVGAAGDRNAKLQLDVETGSSTRRVVHETTIPALLVPQIVSGAALPVLVHPTNPDEIEIQWHLL